MLIDVITRLSAETGLDVVQKRATLVNYAQQAAREIHKKLECNKIYREVTLAVPPNKVVALPAFIGELRGMRMHTNELPFDVNAISQPRYISTTLSYKFKNWRDLGEGATFALPAGFGQLIISSVAVENPVVGITFAGQTNNSQRVEEGVALTALTNATTNLFGTQIYSISSSSVRKYDITIKDFKGNIIAILYNNQRATRYKLVDVSQVFWTIDTDDGSSLIDVLYKVPITELLNDTDQFYAGADYDEAWFNIAMYLYLRPIQNRQADAQAFMAAGFQMLQASKDSSENGIVKKIQFGRNKYMGLFRKYRYYPGSVSNVDHNTQP